jgi:hypothetical protein
MFSLKLFFPSAQKPDAESSREMACAGDMLIDDNARLGPDMDHLPPHSIGAASMHRPIIPKFFIFRILAN